MQTGLYVSTKVTTHTFVNDEFPFSTRINKASICYNSAEDDAKLRKDSKKQLELMRENYKRKNVF